MRLHLKFSPKKQATPTADPIQSVTIVDHTEDDSARQATVPPAIPRGGPRIKTYVAANIGQAMAARILQEIPEYQDAAPELINDLRAGATATAEVLARTCAEGSRIRHEDLAFLRALAARRVHQGVGLEVFIHAYRVALRAYWDACAEESACEPAARPGG